MIEKIVTVKHSVGLHARPASLFIQTAKRYTSKIRVRNITRGGEFVDAKSILSVLTLGVLQNHQISIQAEGQDADLAIDALTLLVESNFGESA